MLIPILLLYLHKRLCKLFIYIIDTMNQSKRIVVIGSSNTDMVIKTLHLPRPGETVLGGDFFMLQGGKGANQAVAVARMGGDTAFLCRVGNDTFGDTSLAAYEQEGIDISHALRDAASPSGVALITVDGAAENCIVVAQGANARLTAADIAAAESLIASAHLVLMQMEIPMEAIVEATNIAARHGVKVVLNPAPAAPIPQELFAKLYLVTPNRTEAETLTGVRVTDLESAKQAADALTDKGVESVVITLGAEGALIKAADDYCHVPAERVEAVDTTAAGDTFNGALCVALVEGKCLADAVRFASKASAIAVTRMGAQASVPMRAEVDAVMNQ